LDIAVPFAPRSFVTDAAPRGLVVETSQVMFFWRHLPHGFWLSHFDFDPAQAKQASATLSKRLWFDCLRLPSFPCVVSCRLS